MNNFVFSERSADILATTKPLTQQIVQRALELSEVDFGLVPGGGFRSAKEQNEMYMKGLSELDGYKKKSRHQSGLAVDVYAYVGKASWDMKHMIHVAAAMYKAADEFDCDVVWGVVWRINGQPDIPHFEFKERT